MSSTLSNIPKIDNIHVRAWTLNTESEWTSFDLKYFWFIKPADNFPRFYIFFWPAQPLSAHWCQNPHLFPWGFLENSIQHPFMSHFCNWQALRMWFCCIAKATWPPSVPATNLVANVEWLGPWTSNTPLIIGNSGSLIKKMGRLFWKLASFLWERLSGLYPSILHPSHPLIAFEHLSLYMRRHLSV